MGEEDFDIVANDVIVLWVIDLEDVHPGKGKSNSEFPYLISKLPREFNKVMESVVHFKMRNSKRILGIMFRNR